MLCQGGVTMAFYIAVPQRIPVPRSHRQTAVILPLPPAITVAISGHGHDAQAAESGGDTSTSLPLEPSEGRSRFWLRPFGCCRLERSGHDVRLECRRLGFLILLNCSTQLNHSCRIYGADLVHFVGLRSNSDKGIRSLVATSSLSSGLSSLVRSLLQRLASLTASATIDNLTRIGLH